jgi:hypothetical protein
VNLRGHRDADAGDGAVRTLGQTIRVPPALGPRIVGSTEPEEPISLRNRSVPPHAPTQAILQHPVRSATARTQRRDHLQNPRHEICQNRTVPTPPAPTSAMVTFNPSAHGQRTTAHGQRQTLMERHALLSTGCPPGALHADMIVDIATQTEPPDPRITVHRQTVPDLPRFQGHPKQKTPGQRLDLGFTTEPPSGFEPETYALRDRERSCCLVPRSAVS